MRRSRTLTRYVAREVVAYTLLGLTLIGAILLLRNLGRALDELLGAGFAASDVWAVLRVIAENSASLTPAEIHQRAREFYPQTSLVTVYRTLDVLVDEATWAARAVAPYTAPPATGFGRELFTNFRRHAGGAEQGACTWL